MKKFLAYKLFFILFINAYTQTKLTLAIIPEPQKINLLNGELLLTENTVIKLDEKKSLIPSNLKDLIYNQIKKYNEEANINNKISSPIVNLVIKPYPKLPTNPEAYSLIHNRSGFELNYQQESALFYGWQTFCQLLPVNNSPVAVPYFEIYDFPRFKWRGLMLDVSRHFFSLEEVKRFIDNMAAYKFNILHFHLTDDEGWRIEIKALPKLTEIGAWRANRTGKWGNTQAPLVYEKKTYGGFYTQDQIKELVEYAKIRQISILPEIDVPGHSMALLAAYPFLSTTGQINQVHTGFPFIDWDKKELFAHLDNTLNPADPRVYQFLDTIFTEIAKLFPFEYIHIGGDECAKNFWENSLQVQQLMKENNITNVEEVQHYFSKKIVQIIESKNKKVIGWDEILDEKDKTDTNLAIMSWRGTKGGIKAAQLNHKVVMTPTTYNYLDYYQGEKLTEPPVYAGLRISKTYSFEPVPENINPNLILGGQGNVWTEQLQNIRSLEYMVWPRAMAIAEVLWSDKNSKNWTHFSQKLFYHFNILTSKNVNFSTAIIDPIISAKYISDSLYLDLKFETNDVNYYYSIDESIPDKFYPKYTQAVYLPDDVENVKIKAISVYKNIQPKLFVIPLSELKKRAMEINK